MSKDEKRMAIVLLLAVIVGYGLYKSHMFDKLSAATPDTSNS